MRGTASDFAALAFACAAVACGGGGSTPLPVREGEVVIGIGADNERGAGVDELRVLVREGGVVREQRSLTRSQLPAEIAVRAAVGAALDVDVRGAASVAPESTIWSRLARVPVTTTERRLLRIPIDGRCVDATGSGSRCAAPQTCISGRCSDSTLLASDLEPYAPDWAVAAPDACRPTGAGSPTLELGTGQSDFSSIAEGATLTVEEGPQGGHHVWVAVRTKNFNRSLFTVTLTGKEPASGAAAPPTSFVFTQETDEGGYCKVYGLRFQLDNGDVDYRVFLNKPFELVADVRDSRGATLRASRRVNIAAGPPSTTGH